MTGQSTDLLPCPFCGAPATLVSNGIYAWVDISCNCGDPSGPPADVIAAWNARYTPAPDHAAWHAAIAEMKAVYEGDHTLAATEYDALMARLAEELSSVRPAA